MGNIFEDSTIKADLKNAYNKQEVIDYSVYGMTHKCKEAKSSSMVAIKIINKKYLERICGNRNLQDCLDNIRHEINCIKEMEGQYSINLIEETETNDYFYIVMDLWDLNLEKYLLNRKAGLKVEEIKKLFKKLNVAFKRMSDKNIIHGNLKLDNILLKLANNELNPILSDYGKKAALDDRLTIMKSTTHYSAPELLVGDEYDYKVDLWSIGVILYRLYFNEFPYNGETQVAIYNDIKKKNPLKKCDNLYFNDLISKLLVIDPNYRISWERYFNHKFWKSEEELEKGVDEDTEEENDSEENSNWRRESKYGNKKSRKHSRGTFYNIYYCLKDNNNPVNPVKESNNNKAGDGNNNENIVNLKDMKKIEFSVEDNITENIDDIISKEITKKINLEYLTKLILYGCNLDNLDILNKLNMVNLLELDLSQNNISSIENISSYIFPKLTTLNLSYNCIHNIEPLSTVSFISLKNLNLSNNLINDIEPLSLVPFTNLDKLKISGNKIRDIQVFTKVPFINLTFLELKNNKINDLTNALGFISINNLLYLDLSHNSIKSIEGLNVRQYQNLISLDLGDNEISNIDLLKEVYFENLKKLDLYDNNIEDINVFGQVPFKGLKELNLSYNRIKSIDILNFMIFENLSKLDLNVNEIDDLISLNQTNLKELKILQLKNNKINKNEDNKTILNNIKKKYKDLNLVYN